MPILLLLNGPPGVGKSTLADRWAAERAGAVCLDPDRARSDLRDAGLPEVRLAARQQVITSAERYLARGADVVVPQLCVRADLPDALRRTARECTATYVEVLLLDSLAHLQRRLRSRATSAEPHHRLVAADVDDEVLQDYRDALVARAAADRSIVVLDCPEGQQEITLRAVHQVAGTG